MAAAYSEASQAGGGPSLGGETTLELDYQWNPTAWLSIQADAQYIINPGGNSDRDDILSWASARLLNSNDR